MASKLEVSDSVSPFSLTLNSYFDIFPLVQARLSNVVEADPDVAAAMDMLSFALYHENTKVIGEDGNTDSMTGQKRDREAPELTDTSDVEENIAQRQRVEEDAAEQAASSSPQEESVESLRQAIYQEVTKSGADSVNVDTICKHVDDRALVAQAIQSLEDDGKLMLGDGEVFLVE